MDRGCAFVTKEIFLLGHSSIKGYSICEDMACRASDSGASPGRAGGSFSLGRSVTAAALS